MSDGDAAAPEVGLSDPLDGIAQLLGLGLVTPAEVAGLRSEELACLVALMVQAEERRAYEELLVLARGLVVLCPFDARGWHAAARALAALGDRGLAEAAHERALALEAAQQPEPAPEPQVASGAAQLSEQSEKQLAQAPSPSPAPPAGPAPTPAQPPAAAAPRLSDEDAFVSSWPELPLFVSRSGKELPASDALPAWRTEPTAPSPVPYWSEEETTQPHIVLSREDDPQAPRREPTITAVVRRLPEDTDALDAADTAREHAERDGADTFEYVTRPQRMDREGGVTAVVRRRQRLPLVDFIDAALGRDD